MKKLLLASSLLCSPAWAQQVSSPPPNPFVAGPGNIMSMSPTNIYSNTGETGYFLILGTEDPPGSGIYPTNTSVGGGGGGAVSSVSNSDGSITISPTTGAVVASLAPAHSNTFTVSQQFNLNAAALPTPLAGTILALANADATATRIELDAYGANSFFSGRRANGTAASPTTLVADNLITNINGLGYDGSAYTTISSGSFRISAAGTWSGSSTPTYLDLYTTAVASTTSASRMRVENSGGITVPPTVTGGDMGAGAFNATALYQGGVQVSALPSYAITGTGGAGFESFVAQSSAPSAPASGFSLYADATGRFSWRRASDGFTRTWDAPITGNHVFTLQDADYTVAGLNITGQTFSATQILSAAGSSSVPTLAFSSAGTNCGFYSTGSNKFDFACNGTAKVWDYNDTNGGYMHIDKIITNNQILAVSGVNLTAGAGYGLIFTPANGTFQFGSNGGATPSILAYPSVNAGTSNTAALTATIAGGKATGTPGAAPYGDVVIQTTNIGAGATSQNTLATAFTCAGGTHNCVFAAQAVLAGSTVAGLPTGVTGGQWYVTDAMTCVSGMTPTGGGSTPCKLWYNGSNWVND